ncbi:MAG: serine hydrolase domain-containing protein [Bacillota bacterium]
MNSESVPNSEKVSNYVRVARTESWTAISNGASSVTTAVMDNGRIVYAEAFGMIDRERSFPANTETQYNIGSISKVFTMIDVLQLCQQRKIELDNPVVQYLPEFVMIDERFKQITVRMLLNHSSGIPGSNYSRLICTAKNSNYISETLAGLRDSILKCEPGIISVYCNDGFTLAEVLVERMSGMSYAEYIENNIVLPAGMRNTSCCFINGNQNVARMYNPKTGIGRPAEYVSAFGTGGIASTATDLCLLSHALFSGELLGLEWVRECSRLQAGPQTVPIGTPLAAFGLGWDCVAVEEFAAEGIIVISKGGGTVEFNCLLAVAPNEKLAVATIVAGHIEASAINLKIMRAALEEKNFIKKSEPFVSLTPVSQPLPEGITDYEGVYCNEASITLVKFDKETNTLKRSELKNAEFVSQDEYIHTGNGKFRLDDAYHLEFCTKNDCKYLLQVSEQSGSALVLSQRITADSAADTSAFEAMIWLPRNLTAGDLLLNEPGVFFRTGVVSNLPGIIYLSSERICTAYGMKDENNCKLILPYGCDLSRVRIVDENNASILFVGAMQFVDARTIPCWRSGERIAISEDGYNAARKIKVQALFASSVPANGRIIVYSPEGIVKFDSLVDPAQTLIVEAEAYVLFIGNPGDLFETR